MSDDFRERLYPKLEEIVEKYKTPFCIYDEKGIIKTATTVNEAFQNASIPFKNFFPVNTIPNRLILRILYNLGFGFLCRSDIELMLCKSINVKGDDIIFSANNPSKDTLNKALSIKKCTLAIDDVAIWDKIKNFPKTICFRYNPGNNFLKNTKLSSREAYYGICDHQIIDVYKQAIERGVKNFGIHMMLYSYISDCSYFIDTARIILERIEKISCKTGIEFDFVNIGGGIIGGSGNNEKDKFSNIANEISALLENFKARNNYCPRLFTTLGHSITKEHGALVTKVINVLYKQEKQAGVDAVMSPLTNPTIYLGEKPITVFKGENRQLEDIILIGSQDDIVDTVIKERRLPQIYEGDLLIIKDIGGRDPYNRIRPKKLLLKEGEVKIIQSQDSIPDILKAQGAIIEQQQGSLIW